MRRGTSRSRRAARGQAAVEAGLGILLLVTVLIFGIHFAEVGYLSMKVTEAANYATWDATGRQIHRYGSNLSTPYRGGSVSSAEQAAKDAYADYDGRASKNGGDPELTFTRGEQIDVTCNVVSGSGGIFPLLNVGGGLGNVYEDNDQGGMRCRASSTLRLINVGSFHDSGNGFFKADHIAQGRTTIDLCSTGRAWGGGGCRGWVPIALGDWSLSDVSNNEAEECDLYGCTNTAYKNTVETAFNTIPHAYGLGTQLSFNVTRFAINEGEYHFSFKGSENNFQQQLNGVHAGADTWTITPGGPYSAVPEYQVAYNARSDCFLGFPCAWKRPGNAN